MTLFDIQLLFNENFATERYKSDAENGLSNHLNNRAFMQEEFGCNLDRENLRIEYNGFQIFINTSENNIPFFRVRYKVYMNDENLPKFWYEMEFDALGNIQDDYFDAY